MPIQTSLPGAGQTRDDLVADCRAREAQMKLLAERLLSGFLELTQ